MIHRRKMMRIDERFRRFDDSSLRIVETSRQPRSILRARMIDVVVRSTPSRRADFIEQIVQAIGGIGAQPRDVIELSAHRAEQLDLGHLAKRFCTSRPYFGAS